MRNKRVAARLALLLGFVGIHKFYLGRIRLGILYYLLSLAPTPWIYLIPMILSIYDFFIIVSSSKEAFDNKYNKEITYYIGSRSPQNSLSGSEALEIYIIKFCSENKDRGVTMSEIIIEVGIEPLKCKEVVNKLVKEDLLDFKNRPSDGAVVYSTF